MSEFEGLVAIVTGVASGIVATDVSDDASVRAAVTAVVERFGRLDIVGMARVTRAMAADHLREGIRFNAVNPGTADTPWITGLLSEAADPASERAALEARQPHGRLVTPDEIASAAAYLASPLSGSTTGTSIAVDGGIRELRLRSE